ncbi:hypothetical protein [Ensifer adhaerens]|uniref:Cytochrome c domain-containing protein n=1 Tax=Ensifer adhaerens TaxID=106592 RepID=A0A9Q8YE51_ENSAD|nr:hypothetical protein [Ensifer adhaerens]USJ27570.1 hypothetical protein NE863_34685 [Ensifer adhaerens]
MRFVAKRNSLSSAILLISGLFISQQPAAAGGSPPLAANDVSILFPLPTSGNLLDFITIADLKGIDDIRLLSDAAFDQFIAVSESADSKIATGAGSATQIAFPAPTKNAKDWLVAGIRLDVGAPGLSANVMDKFGQIPQVRLILQPVTPKPGGGLTVHDRAAHVIFSFAKGFSQQQENCQITVVPRIEPDLDAFRPLLDDFKALRDDLADGKFGDPVDTSGPLKVHPGLAAPGRKAVRDRIEAILEKHLKAKQVTALAVMGLPAGAPEPWIFMPMRRNPGNDTVSAVPSPTLDGQAKAQLLKFLGSDRVLPAPKTDNQAESMTTCFRKPADRVGVSTVELFSASATPQRTVEVTETIADPSKSHFFNTDCLSCHTETRLLLAKSPGTAITGVDASVLPETQWNVRNFGWGSEFGRMKPTITRRTATETDEVVNAANLLLSDTP